VQKHRTQMGLYESSHPFPGDSHYRDVLWTSVTVLE